MIIPVRCFTCGKILANKYETYKKMVAQNKKTEGETIIDVNNVKKTPEGKALDIVVGMSCCLTLSWLR